jgi:hypothetical protein
MADPLDACPDSKEETLAEHDLHMTKERVSGNPSFL